MLEITRISLPKDAPAAKGRCARGTGRHWPKPQRLGTEPDGGLLGRLPGTPRVAALFRPPKKKTGTAWAVPVAVCAATGRSRPAIIGKARNILTRQGLRIDLNGVLDLNGIIVPGQHIRKLHHAGRASRRHDFRTAGDYVVALALAHLERQVIVGQR